MLLVVCRRQSARCRRVSAGEPGAAYCRGFAFGGRLGPWRHAAARPREGLPGPPPGTPTPPERRRIPTDLDRLAATAPSRQSDGWLACHGPPSRADEGGGPTPGRITNQAPDESESRLTPEEVTSEESIRAASRLGSCFRALLDRSSPLQQAISVRRTQ